MNTLTYDELKQQLEKSLSLNRAYLLVASHFMSHSVPHINCVACKFLEAVNFVAKEIDK